MATKVVFQFHVYGEAESGDEPQKSVKVEVNSVEGTDEQQPTISVYDRASGLDARIALPKGDYSGVSEVFASLGQDAEGVERTVRKVAALFNLIR